MRDATVGALANVPALALPAVAMATPVDLIFTAIERDRIAYVAFIASVNPTDEVKAAQAGVASHKSMRTPTKPPAKSRRMPELVATVAGMRRPAARATRLE